ncbi:MAG TPA: iron ABC transporter substrate-binding protein [Actinomycetota bacterium]|nr:iron ABC transporter substrate-binding protein [Actinomycetota bacterium]
MRRTTAALFAVIFLLAACNGADTDDPAGDPTPAAEATLEGEAEELVVYSGRSEELVGPVFAAFEEATGITLSVRYGDTAEMAAQILEEGDNSPADVYFGQDAGALGALENANRFVTLPEDLISGVPSQFRSVNSQWTGVTGRSRVAVYNPDRVNEEELPDSILEFTDERWRDRLGWAPTNGSFQAFVTGLRELEGEERAREWLTQMQALGTRVYANNGAIVQATSAGEIDAGFVNHYYAYQIAKREPGLRAANHFFTGGDPGALVNVAGVGILRSSDAQATAGRLVEYLLSEDAQNHFATESSEYPMIDGIAIDERLTPLDELQPPDIDLSDLEDLEGTLALLREVGLL